MYFFRWWFEDTINIGDCMGSIRSNSLSLSIKVQWQFVSIPVNRGSSVLSVLIASCQNLLNTSSILSIIGCIIQRKLFRVKLLAKHQVQKDTSYHVRFIFRHDYTIFAKLFIFQQIVSYTYTYVLTILYISITITVDFNNTEVISKDWYCY